jgi:hypothetical protein
MPVGGSWYCSTQSALSRITGFQPEEGDVYVERQGGFWMHHPS